MQAHLVVVIAFVHVVNLFHYGLMRVDFKLYYFGLTAHISTHNMLHSLSHRCSVLCLLTGHLIHTL